MIEGGAQAPPCFNGRPGMAGISTSSGKAALTLFLVASVSPAFACGYDGLLGSVISQMTPGSIDVSLALYQGVSDGVLDAALVSPDFKKDLLGTGYRRAATHLKKLSEGLKASPSPPFSLVLVEASLWARFDPTSADKPFAIHLPAATPGDAIVVTGGAVLAAIAAGRITPDEAFRRKLIVIDAPPQTAPAIRDALAAALPALTGKQKDVYLAR